MTLDSSQQVIRENQETRHRRHLVTGLVPVLADRDLLSRCAVVSYCSESRCAEIAPAPDKPMAYRRGCVLPRAFPVFEVVTEPSAAQETA